MQVSAATHLASIERRLLEKRAAKDSAGLQARHKELLQVTAQLLQHAHSFEQQKAEAMLGQTAQLVMEERVVSLFQRALAAGQADRALGFAAAPLSAGAASPARRHLQRMARKVVHENREQGTDAAPVPLVPRRAGTVA